MHTKLQVTTNKFPAEPENNLLIRKYVDLKLSEIEASGEHPSLNDWHVIGGRWSGKNSKLFNKFYKELKKQNLVQNWMTINQVENNKIKYQKIWEDLGGEYENPINRGNYNQLGYDDDANIITKTLYKKIKKYEGKSEGFGDEGYKLYYLDLEKEKLNPDMIGKKWLVLVDYHN